MNKNYNIHLKMLQKKLKLKFKNISLLKRAFIHKSYVNETKNKKIESNEKLELLGDAVLSLIVIEFLYKKYSQLQEGRISKIKSFIVSKANLSNISKNLNLGEYLILGKGERLTKTNFKEKMLCDVLESLIGAYYLDSGIKKVSQWVISYIIKEKESLKNVNIKDYKTELQIKIQKKSKICPQYRLKTVNGPDHKKTFQVEVLIENKVFGKGKGNSIKIAQQQAAFEALQKLG